MKHFSIILLTTMFIFCSYAQARTVYDSTGRTIVHDGTIRGQRHATEQRIEQRRKIEAAAAAKIDYEAALKSLEKQEMKSNYYQDRIKEKEKAQTQTETITTTQTQQ